MNRNTLSITLLTAFAALVWLDGLAQAATVAAGTSHSLAAKEDGTVWAWGANSQGQLGDGTTIQRQIPVQVVDLTDIVAVAASGGGLDLQRGILVPGTGSWENSSELM